MVRPDIFRELSSTTPRQRSCETKMWDREKGRASGLTVLQHSAPYAERLAELGRLGLAGDGQGVVRLILVPFRIVDLVPILVVRVDEPRWTPLRIVSIGRCISSIARGSLVDWRLRATRNAARVACGGRKRGDPSSSLPVHLACSTSPRRAAAPRRCPAFALLSFSVSVRSRSRTRVATREPNLDSLSSTCSSGATNGAWLSSGHRSCVSGTWPRAA